MEKPNNQDVSNGGFQPFVAPHTKMPEMTLRAVLLGLFFAIVFCTTSVYLALKAGYTAGGSIPTAVIAISVLRRFRKSTILENNMVQTIASAGESIATGVCFTTSAFLFLGAARGESYFHYSQILTLALVGGFLGILFMIPLRKSLIVKEHGKLLYPEGTACAEVLVAGEKKGDLARPVFAGAIVASLYVFWMRILNLWNEVPFLIKTSSKALYSNAVLSLNISPEYLGIGYIIGPKSSSQMITGGLLAWLLFVPLFSSFPSKLPSWVGMNRGYSTLCDFGFIKQDLKRADKACYLIVDRNKKNVVQKETEQTYRQYINEEVDEGGNPKLDENGRPKRITDEKFEEMYPLSARELHKSYVQWIGIGAVVFAGIITLLKTLPMIIRSFRSSVSAWRDKSNKNQVRTEKDIPNWLALLLAGAMVILLALVPNLPGKFPSSLLLSGLIVVFGFFFVTVSSRFVGEVGYNSDPVSSMVYTTTMGTCLVFILLGWVDPQYQAWIIMISAVVCIAAGNAGATSQDLKTGYLLGATPYKQQLGLVIGVILSSVVVGGTLLLIDQSNPSFVHAIGQPPNGAPQARILATLVQVILDGKMPWRLVALGVVISVCAELLGAVSLSIAAGLYLPVEVTAVIFCGGLIRGVVNRRQKNNEKIHIEGADKELQPGMLYATGLIAGGAIAGMLIGFFQGFLPDVASQLNIATLSDGKAYWEMESLTRWADYFSLLIFFSFAFLLYRHAVQTQSSYRTYITSVTATFLRQKLYVIITLLMIGGVRLLSLLQHYVWQRFFGKSINVWQILSEKFGIVCNFLQKPVPYLDLPIFLWLVVAFGIFIEIFAIYRGAKRFAEKHASSQEEQPSDHWRRILAGFIALSHVILYAIILIPYFIRSSKGLYSLLALKILVSGLVLGYLVYGLSTLGFKRGLQQTVE